MPKGDLIPVCVAAGMITLSTTFGAYTALHQLGRAPNVLFLTKSRRETIPEVVEPDRTAEEAKKFVKRSFFRKMAHIKDSDRPWRSDPIREDIFSRPLHVETLKDIGVDPKLN